MYSKLFEMIVLDEMAAKDLSKLYGLFYHGSKGMTQVTFPNAATSSSGRSGLSATQWVSPQVIRDFIAAHPNTKFEVKPAPKNLQIQ
jgi:hypothetical protein